MIEEAYVSFETAKLAKEKGFDEPCKEYYECGNDYTSSLPWGTNQEDFRDEKDILAPTQAMLARWLREKYNVHVIPKPIYDSDRLEQYGCDIHCPDKNGLVFTIISPVFPVYKQTSNHNMTKELGTYEESMEAGLQEALKLI